jgi:hypothetical protein
VKLKAKINVDYADTLSIVINLACNIHLLTAEPKDKCLMAHSVYL